MQARGQSRDESRDEYGAASGPLQGLPPVAAALAEPAIHSRVTLGCEKRPLSLLVCWLWLAGPALVLSLSWLMSVGQGRQVNLPVGWPLPEICTLHARLGLDCPGCGLTRSFIHLADGNPHAAWQLNPVGILLFVYVLAQLPLAGLHLQLSLAQRSVQPRWLVQWSRWNERVLASLMLALLLQWIARLVTGELFG